MRASETHFPRARTHSSTESLDSLSFGRSARSTSDAGPAVQIAFLDGDAHDDQQLTLEHVLNDVYEYPASIDGLLEFCERQYCAENLQFLLAVRNFRKLKTWDEVQHCAWEIMEEFIQIESPQEVNIESKTRKKTIDKVTSAIFQKEDVSPINNPDEWRLAVSAFDSAWREIYRVFAHDVMHRFKAEVIHSERVRLSRKMALWCCNPASRGWKFFTFPNPVNTADARGHAICAFCMACTIVALNVLHLLFQYDVPHFRSVSLLIFIYMVYGYAARTLCGPRLDPQAFFVLFVLTPLLVDKLKLISGTNWVPSPPRRFSQGIGFFVSSLGFSLYYFELYWPAVAVMTMFAGVVFVVAAFDYCIGCWVYYSLINSGLFDVSAIECDVKYLRAAPKSPSSKPDAAPLPVTSADSTIEPKSTIENELPAITVTISEVNLDRSSRCASP